MRSLILVCLAAAPAAWAQTGDNPGEAQPPPPATMVIPPAPPLAPAEAIKTIHAARGFKVELVAADPVVQCPVEIEFDADGRMFVLEMRAYMPNPEGKGEDQPIGRVSLLEDTDGDGRMDKATVFVDGLQMPRAIAVVGDGLLVAEPPRLWWFRDTNHDGKADEKTEVAHDYGSQANPEHTANGLIWGLDNWIYSANHTARYRFLDGEWKQEPAPFRGQWGITQDDFGRQFFTLNSEPLRGDLVPAHYLNRNPNFKKNPFGGNVQIEKNFAVWPLRVNPGVNRGYNEGQLRPDGTLATYTAACASCIYRGDIFPPRFSGAAFLCEPSANVVRCELLTEHDGLITATNAFDKTEFIASTDERFRPVNLSNGPDGALYVVDMYHGIIEHRIYLTTYLRKQIEARGLDKFTNLGRIYRIVPDGFKRTSIRKMNGMNPAELVQQLRSKNGWARDTAQRLLVERHNSDAVPELKALVKNNAEPLAQLHSLWTLDGMGEIDRETLLAASNASHTKVRAAAIRLSEPYLRAEGRSDVFDRVLALKNDSSADVLIQLTISLGEIHKPEAEEALLAIFQNHLENPIIRDGAVTGLTGRELPFLTKLLALESWKTRTAAREEFVRELSQCIFNSRNPETINELLDLTASKESWQQVPLLDGMLSLLPAKTKTKTVVQVKPVNLPSEPKGFVTLKNSTVPELAERVKNLDSLLLWPGKAGALPPIEVKPLTDKEKESFESGKALFTAICAACHQPHGKGLEGLAPPLVDSEWVVGSPDRLTRILLQGVRGPLNVNGKTWALEMPPLNILEDAQLADVMTYIRREWAHTASPVPVDMVAKIRESTKTREEAWNEADLLKIQ
jgi:glucose/arabinose dehydrogenase/mono/diheme cytochrome c family protein